MEKTKQTPLEQVRKQMNKRPSDIISKYDSKVRYKHKDINAGDPPHEAGISGVFRHSMAFRESAMSIFSSLK